MARLSSAGFIFAVLISISVLYLVNPTNSNLFPRCPFLAMTGCYCPGCGSLRAIHQLARGELVAALGLNPMMVLSVPFIAYYFTSQLKLTFFGQSLRRFFIQPVFIWSLLLIILVYWILRNIPVYPFSLLAP
ncbi:DUF2752 domain-containing protein [Rubrobacter aplysinae]|uniref:DUF2752 domain-containing protein n=1 Tax=Rubrobacter aplysinae TaxID=909625 RepID=UPI00389A4A86